MSHYLLLGPVSFSGFELPGRIGFGGAQRLAVHTLPGGVRVIDAMGHDDADISWTGTFSGSDATERARLLDLLRAQGPALPLAWESFCYVVIIAQFEAHYEHSNWVPFRITCKVIRDEAQAAIASAVSLTARLLSDLAAASAVDSTGAVAALGVSGATAPGTTAYASANGVLSTLARTISVRMASANSVLAATPDVASATTSAGHLATLADARSYISRARTNLANAAG